MELVCVVILKVAAGTTVYYNKKQRLLLGTK
jgi:hypothetical protein